MTKIDLLTGFLGSGKTTFLRRYVDWLGREGVRYLVLENEYGVAGIDTVLLRTDLGKTVFELAGGCACCTLKNAFTLRLEALAQECDRIVVETSGVYNLDAYFEAVAPLVEGGIAEPGLCLTLIDPHTLLAPSFTQEARDVLRDELVGTGGVLWTKLDLPPAVDLEAARGVLSDVLAATPDVFRNLRFCETPSHRFGDADFAGLQTGYGPIHVAHGESIQNHAFLYNSATISPKGLYRAERLVEGLERLFASGEAGRLLRVKGFANDLSGASYVVNGTLGGCSAVPCKKRSSVLNFIGQDIDAKSAEAILERYAE